MQANVKKAKRLTEISDQNYVSNDNANSMLSKHPISDEDCGVN